MILPVCLEYFPLCQFILFNQIEKCDLEVYPVIFEVILPFLKKRDPMKNVQMGQSQKLMFEIF